MAVTPGDGTVLQIDNIGFQTIGQLVSIQPINAERGELDATDLSDAWEEVKMTFKRGGEIQATLNYDPADANHALLWTSFGSGTLESWKVILADAGVAEITFSGYVKTFPVETLEKENLARLVVTIRISGAVTITP